MSSILLKVTHGLKPKRITATVKQSKTSLSSSRKSTSMVLLTTASDEELNAYRQILLSSLERLIQSRCILSLTMKGLEEGLPRLINHLIENN